jgi:hypothetical protein
MGMQNIASLNRASATTLHTTRELIHDESFCRRHRTSDKHFTRRRKLPFVNVMVMLLQKTIRSIQLHLHGFFAALAVASQSATASSWCEARLKLKHTAFIELNQEGQSAVVELRPPNGSVGAFRAAGLPERLRVRFVTVRLSTGELEVLATDLLDEALYPTAEFGELYHQRWGIETYYGLVKSRLDLENFTGLSAEAIRQDLYATIFLSNLESILIQPAQAQLRQASAQRKHAAQSHGYTGRVSFAPRNAARIPLGSANHTAYANFWSS